MAKKPTIQASFTIDKQQFDKSIKDLNKQVNSAKKDFNEINKEAKRLSKDLNDISKKAKSLGMDNIADNVKDVTKELKNVSKQFTTVNKEVSKTQKEINNMGKIDLTSVNKLSDILKSVRNFDVIKEGDLKDAVDRAKELARTLNSINGFSVDVNNISNRTNALDILARNTSANGYADTFINNDQNRFFNRLINQVADISQKIDSKPKEENDKLISAIDKLTLALKNAGDKLSAGYNNKPYTPNYKTANLKSELKDPIVRTSNPFDYDEIATIARLVDLWDQAAENMAKYERYGKMSATAQAQINKELDRQFKEYDDILEAEKEILAANKKIQEENEQITKEVNEQNKQLDDSVGKLRKFYDIIQKGLGTAGIKLPEFDQMADKAEKAGINVDDLAQSLFGASKASKSTTGALTETATATGSVGTASTGATSAIGGLSAGMVALAGAIVAVVAAITAYVAIMVKLVDIMQKASQIASDFEQATVKLANQMGITAEATDKLRDSLNEAFREQGITNDINEMTEALRAVQQILGEDITTDFGKQLAEQLMIVSQTTDYEIREIARTVDANVKHFGISTQQALDGILYMYQQTGDTYHDLVDTMFEYSSKVEDLGISYETFLSGIAAGSDSALMNLDKVGQMFEELNDTLTTEPDKAIENLNKLGLSYSKLMEDFKKGGQDADNAFNAIISGINNMKDTAEKQNVIAELFKSPGQEISMDFFTMLEDAKVSINDLSGTATEAHQNMINTIEYQQNEFNNKIQSTWDKIGESVNEVLLPILTDINKNFDTIWNAVETKLAPAFQNLAYSIAFAFGIDGPMDFSNVLIFIIDCVSNVINFIAKVTWYTRKWYDVCMIGWDIFSILFNIMQNGFTTISTLFSVLVAGFTNGFMGILHTAFGVIEGIVTSFGNGFGMISDIFTNMGIGISNIWNKITTSLNNMWVKNVQRPIAEFVNNTFGTNWSTGTIKSYQKQEFVTVRGWDDAWGSGNSNFAKAQEYKDKGIDAMKDALSAGFNSFNKNMEDIFHNANQIGERIDRVFNTSFDDYKDQFQENFSSQTDALTSKLDELIDTVKDTNEPGKYNGKDQTSKDKANAKKKADDAKKKAEQQQKEYEAALEKAQQAAYKYYEDLIRYLTEVQQKRIQYETQIAEQQWKAQEMSIDLLQQQYDFYGSIMERYKLSTDEMISYSQKQYDIALQMKEYALSEAKKLIQEELDAKKDALKEEEDALIKSNDKKIKEYEGYIKEIERQLKSLENQWEDEDRQEEIDKVKKELEKYKDATSTEGIKRRQELEEQLNNLLKEKERDEIKDRLEDQKDGWKEQIEGLEDANDKIKEEYEDKYQELEETVEVGEMNIKDIQEYIRDEANKKLKEQLQEMVNAYEEACKQMQDSALSMETILKWEQIDKDRQDIINNLTGKPNNDFDDMKDDEKLNPDYVKIKELQAQWSALGDGKNSSNPKIKAQQDALNKQANAIRAKYGLKYPDMPPKYLPKYHNGGVVNGYELSNGDVPTLLQNREVVFTQKQFNDLVDFLDGFKLNPNMFGRFIDSNTMKEVNYNSTLNFNIDKIEMKNKMDTRKMLQEAETYRRTSANSKGKRKL